MKPIISRNHGRGLVTSFVRLFANISIFLDEQEDYHGMMPCHIFCAIVL